MHIIQKRKYFYAVSLFFVGASIVAFALWGLKLGIDFTGGTLMEVRFAKEQVTTDHVQELLADISLEGFSAQSSVENSSIILRYGGSDEAQNERVLAALRAFDNDVTQIRVDFISATISQQLKKKAIIALVLATAGIALYIAWAFRKVAYPVPSWQYGLNAVIALAHDVIITIGAFAFLGRFWDVEIGVPFIAALLTILGYSINDTIVVYDRVRENILRARSVGDFEGIVNISLNETIARSFNTSLTVILVLIAMIFFGEPTLLWFSVALLLGIGSGTYSSIYVAAALLVTSHKITEQAKRTQHT